MKQVDFLIVGQGLAGTALAWCLHFNGYSFAILDENLPISCSKIAAGLVTPITGKRLARSWRFAELWETALPFYRRVEQVLGQEFFVHHPTLRLLKDEDEIALYQHKQSDGFYRNIESTINTWSHPEIASQIHHALEMPQAGRLQTVPYLSASREFFAKQHHVETTRFRWSDVEFLSSPSVQMPRYQLQAKWLILATGAQMRHMPQFASLQFRPAKGQILTLKVPDWNDSHVLHCGFWMAPYQREQQLIRIGATYEWDLLDQTATQQGASELLQQFESFYSKPYEVVGHQAAVRPVMKDNFPVAGVEANGLPVALLNGLGSKGTLQAPWCAGELVAHLTQQQSLEREIDYLARKTHRPKSPAPK